jgi:hypothetical protein
MRPIECETADAKIANKKRHPKNRKLLKSLPVTLNADRII